jgi:hypothetical protein
MPKSKKQTKTSRTMKNRTRHAHKIHRKTVHRKSGRKTAHRKIPKARRATLHGGMMSFMSMFNTPKPQQPSTGYSDISDWDREYNAPTAPSAQRPSVGIATVTYNTQDEIKNMCRQLGIDETKVNAALIADALNNKSAFINGQSINGWSNLGRQIMVKDAIKYLSDEDKVRFLPMLGSKYEKLTMPAHQLVLDARKNIEAKYAKRW